MKIICNVTGSERKRMAEVLGAYLLTEPVYKKAPTFAYVVSDYTIDKNGTIFCPVSATVEDVAGIVTKLTDEGFSPEIEDVAPVDEDTPSKETLIDEAPAETPAETPDVAPEAEAEAQPEDEATEAAVGAETPDAAVLEEDGADEDEASGAYEDKLAVSIPRAKLPDDALSRLRTIISNKEELFKRALLTDALPIEVVDECIFFPWFTMTGIDGEANAYLQFITALCQMAVEQKRVLDKPYDGDNDRFAMRIFMVRLNMKGPQFALARKLMMKHLTGNSGWRYEDSAAKSKNRSQPSWATVHQLKNIYQTDTRIELIPTNDATSADIHIGDRGTVIDVDESGSVFIRLDNGSTFGIAFSTEAAEAPEAPEAPAPEDEPDAPVPDEDALPDEDEPDGEEVSE